MAKREWGNPYTHEEHSRESIPGREHPCGCDWCGQKRRVLFRYDRRKGWFCNLECHNSFHF